MATICRVKYGWFIRQFIYTAYGASLFILMLTLFIFDHWFPKFSMFYQILCSIMLSLLLSALYLCIVAIRICYLSKKNRLYEFTVTFEMAIKTKEKGIIIPSKYVSSAVIWSFMGILVWGLIGVAVASLIGAEYPSDEGLLVILLFMLFGIMHGITANKAWDRALRGFAKLELE